MHEVQYTIVMRLISWIHSRGSETDIVNIGHFIYRDSRIKNCTSSFLIEQTTWSPDSYLKITVQLSLN
jgi:hypothetical protein